MFLFGKGACIDKECTCFCLKGIPATKENCAFRVDSDYDVYAYGGVESVSTTEAIPKKATGNTFNQMISNLDLNFTQSK